MNHTSNIKEESSLPKPMLALVIAALISSPTFLAGCSSTQPKPDTLSSIEPRLQPQPLATNVENEDIAQAAMADSANEPNIIEQENEIIAQIQSEPEEVESMDSVLMEIDQAIDEIAAVEFERPAKTVFKFGFDQKQLTDEELNIISEHGLYLSQNPEKKIQIHGHADAQGAPIYNQHLAKQRADHVAEVLKQAGVTNDQIEIVSWGSEKPAPSATHWKDNRRVEIVYEEAFVVQAPTEENNFN